MKTKETNPTRPGSPTPCKQALSEVGQDSQATQDTQVRQVPRYTVGIIYEVPTETMVWVGCSVSRAQKPGLVMHDQRERTNSPEGEVKLDQKTLIKAKTP